MNKPLWELPQGWSHAEHEGREAFRANHPMEHRYGETLSGIEWERGWRAERAKDIAA